MSFPTSRFRAHPLALILAAPLLWAACADSPGDSVTGPAQQTVVTPTQDAGYGAAISVQDRHTAALLSRGGILGTGVSIDDEGRHVIAVYTLRPDPANLPTDLDGIPLVPVATGMFVAGNVNDPTTKERPAPNGFSVGHPSITAGTIGALVKNGAGNLFILSNNHVLANSNDANIGDAALQPGPFDGGTSADQIGTLAAFEPINFSGGNNTIDAAIASVNGSDVTGATPSYAYGAPGTTTTSAFVGQGVQKFGRTTLHTTGSVAETNVTVDVCYETRGPFRCSKLGRFVNQISISDGSFSDGGDSGSLIVTNDGNKNPVGLLYAGSDTRTIANPIDDVLAAFGVSITSDPGSGTGNNPPTAAFTFGCIDLACDFDAGGSSDSDGSIASYDWDFGDGNSGSGVTTSHTYGAAGTFTVVLTVTDDGGAADTDSQDVTVSEPGNGGFSLSTTGYKVRGLQKADLTWTGASGSNVDIYRDGSLIATTANDGAFTDNIDQRGGGSYVYQVCEAGTSTCSNQSTVNF